MKDKFAINRPRRNAIYNNFLFSFLLSLSLPIPPLYSPSSLSRRSAEASKVGRLGFRSKEMTSRGDESSKSQRKFNVTILIVLLAFLQFLLLLLPLPFKCRFGSSSSLASLLLLLILLFCVSVVGRRVGKVSPFINRSLGHGTLHSSSSRRTRTASLQTHAGTGSSVGGGGRFKNRRSGSGGGRGTTW